MNATVLLAVRTCVAAAEAESRVPVELCPLEQAEVHQRVQQLVVAPPPALRQDVDDNRSEAVYAPLSSNYEPVHHGTNVATQAPGSRHRSNEVVRAVCEQNHVGLCNVAQLFAQLHVYDPQQGDLVALRFGDVADFV